MEGAYVDSSFSLVLIVADCVDESGEVVEWTAHTKKGETKLYRSASASSGWITTCEQSRGCYDGVGRIVWDDPLDKWNRVTITSHQWQLMTTRRPYVPLMFVFFAMLRQCVIFMGVRLKSSPPYS